MLNILYISVHILHHFVLSTFYATLSSRKGVSLKLALASGKLKFVYLIKEGPRVCLICSDSPLIRESSTKIAFIVKIIEERQFSDSDVNIEEAFQ